LYLNFYDVNRYFYCRKLSLHSDAIPTMFRWAIKKLKFHEMHLPSFPHTRHSNGMT